jgi:uncharacterized protein YcaQ
MEHIADDLFNFGLTHGGDVGLWINLANNHLRDLETRELKELSTLANGWWRWDDEAQALLFVLMNEWLKYVEHAAVDNQ